MYKEKDLVSCSFATKTGKIGIFSGVGKIYRKPAKKWEIASGFRA
jgi:hypothetical protein